MTMLPATAAADFPRKSRRFIPDESLMCAPDEMKYFGQHSRCPAGVSIQQSKFNNQQSKI
jgi:hypothetical protein